MAETSDWNQEDRLYMKMALELAAEGRGKTLPNPMVGAVVVKNGEVVGRGFHPGAGSPHAEVFALREGGDRCGGATLYLTLEPCCYFGRTPPCTNLIVEHGIARLVCAVPDPNPRVDGKGVQQLEEAGIAVEIGLMGAAARILNEVYFKNVTRHLPFVTLKIACTLDGKIADRHYNARWITGKPSQVEVHRIRAEKGGVLIGINTVLQDDPELTVRHVKGENPCRIVLDTHLRIPPDAKVVTENKDRRTVICTAGEPLPGKAASGQARLRRNTLRDNTLKEAVSGNEAVEKEKFLAGKGVEIWGFPTGPDGKIDLVRILKKCYTEKIYDLLVEGGKGIFTSFIRGRAADRLIFVMAPKVMGEEHLSGVGSLGIDTVEECLSMENIRFRQIGEDIWIEGDPLYTGGTFEGSSPAV